MVKTTFTFDDKTGEVKSSTKNTSAIDLFSRVGGFEIAAFKERDDINQFLRDGDLINDLYDQTLDVLSTNNRSFDEEGDVLKVFNAAYRICWLVAQKRESFSEVTRLVYFRKTDTYIRDISYCVAWCILKVYSELYEFDNSILELIRKRVNRLAFFTDYRELVRMQDDPCFPINFAEPGIYHRPSRCICDNIDESDIILNFLRHSSVANGEGSMLEVDEDEDSDIEIQPLDEVLETSFMSIRNTVKALTEENNRLAFAIHEAESNHMKAIEGKDATISRLRFQNAYLTRQLNEKESKVEVKEVEVVKEVVKENPLQKVLNWDTITNYALSLGNFKDVQAIMIMINRMSLRGQCYDDNIEQNIQKLEAYIRELQKPVYNQTNHIGGDYVETQNNHHLTSETHE